MEEQLVAQSTPLSREQLAYYLNAGWIKLFGFAPSKESLSILWAQVILETGGRSILWNLGNVKRIAGHDWCAYKCSEILSGKEQFFSPMHPQTFFCAYRSPEQGVKEYIEFVSKRKRYAKAWQAVLNGDPADYAHQLKLANYYTASEALYVRGVVALSKEFMKIADKVLSPTYAVDLPKRVDVLVCAPINATPENTIKPTIHEILKSDHDIDLEIPELEQINFMWNEDDHQDINAISPIDLGPQLKIAGIFNIIFKFILDLIKLFGKKK